MPIQPSSSGPLKGGTPPTGKLKSPAKTGSSPIAKGGIKRLQPLKPLKPLTPLSKNTKSPGRPPNPGKTKPTPALKPNKPTKPGLRS